MNETMKAVLLAAMLCGWAGAIGAAETQTISLSGPGWMCDGNLVCVPHTWNATDGADGSHGEGARYNERRSSAELREGYVRKEARYTRALPDPTPGRRQFIRFEAVSQKARVFVNEREVGRHVGAFTAFCFEITKFLKPTGNELVVLADNTYDLSVPPISGDFTIYGGIYRDVWLIETPQVCVDRTIDGGPGMELDIRMDGRVTARVHVLGGEDVVRELHFPNPKLWTPETPHLYTATVTLDSGDSVSLDFGFRTCEFREDGFFYLNGERRFLRGVNRHQDREGKGWAISAADEREDVALIKEIGADAVRTAHCPASERFYSLCDRAGFIVWCENPLVNGVSFGADFDRNLRTMYREMVAQLKHHPSICMWSFMNELYCTYIPQPGVQEDVVEPYAKWAKTLDPTRPQVAAGWSDDYTRASNIAADGMGFNKYPGWYDKGTVDEVSRVIDEMFARHPRWKALCMSEYGAGASIFHHDDPAVDCHYWTPHNEEYQARAVATVYDAMLADGRFWGSFVWLMFDFGSDHRNEGDRAGINNKGLVTFDRKTKKDAYWFYRSLWTKDPVLHLVGTRREKTGETTDILVFSNVGDVTLEVNGTVVGTQKPDRVRRAHFKKVPMQKGENVVRVTAGGKTMCATWTREE